VGAVLEVDVLVVDDDQAVRESGAEILRSAGLTVAEAENGEIALELLGEIHPRVILLDLQMPCRDGLAFIASIDGSTPVIVMSGCQMDDSTRQRLRGRVSDLLLKPVPPLVLMDKVVAACSAYGFSL
jgi:two-component system response regulator YesN